MVMFFGTKIYCLRRMAAEWISSNRDIFPPFKKQLKITRDEKTQTQLQRNRGVVIDSCFAYCRDCSDVSLLALFYADFSQIFSAEYQQLQLCRPTEFWHDR